MGIVSMKTVELLGSKDGAQDSLSNASSTDRRKEHAKTALPRRLCSLADAASYLAVSDWTVRQMIWRGDLPHIRRGKRVLLDLQDLERWIAREKVRGV